ncbi:ubiquitin/ribosomal protein S27 fusion protein [Thecamonas trahens ATCC 50062]|uniref:Ubiquitin/ribosomal protein S27 fusion protein n=1 Tax=Thecamonas trahens ATCC 50062 TaxID=461836 RepID=A0A0L0DJC2_THETB|nr:ubiquitin/ribosomal protein S27 fusion protein [Thecamonas trahens ATCC 50062]KNC52504.1 ubiquitin/ribosomal protein S27 fusion protein [Thecamonas trahens ATCC 50062]|eukprot:XP_013755298.1 ubiquitin/ribosomal protein S27 fusion protein [Thecamonas trahens ATCC 50062]
MQIFVKFQGKSTAVDVTAASVDEFRADVAARTGVPAAEQVLAFNGKLLSELSALEHGDTINMNLRLAGGAKKRKKKVYTTPKKVKHQKKKVKLAVLAYYQVDNNGKITRLRRECPDCDAGVFMATHFDRQYCGKCGLTYVFDQQQ